LLLVVNPSDENSIRIASAYQQLRHIPDRNIVFLQPPTEGGFTTLSTDRESVWPTYVTNLAQTIQQRGLQNQIDFIAALGQTHSFSDSGDFQSLSYLLTQLPQYSAGMDAVTGQSISFGIGANPNSPATFEAVHSTDMFTVPWFGGNLQHHYYMGGLLAATNRLGNSADQVIQNLERTVAADGTHPVGTVYLEENDDVRSDTRESQWPAAKQILVARGIKVVEEREVSGNTPQDRNDVRGAVVGFYAPTLPNGSTYLPGSWADNLTSYGGKFSPEQVKATEFIAAGAAGSSGTVEEPYANANRFPTASIYAGIDNGLTLAEAYYHSVRDPDMLQFFGDLLAQPYGDIPQITFTTAPVNNSTVSGNVSLTVTATVPAGGQATEVSRLELWVDGTLKSSRAGASGTLTFNSTAVSDGVHELKIVAIANNGAESEGIAVRNVEVRNQLRRISTAASSYSAASTAMLHIPLTMETNSGSIVRAELRHMGRVVASAAGPASELSLQVAQLAFGMNTLVPVAVFSDGSEVAGRSVVVTRSANSLSGATPTPIADRVPGVKSEYFLGTGRSSIAASDFSGQPSFTRTHGSMYLDEGTAADEKLATNQIDNLAIRFTGRFVVDAANAGETLFSLIETNDSAQLTIDGQIVMSYDDLSYGYFSADSSKSVFLASGEHIFELLVANTGSGTDPGFNIDLRMRGTDGVTHILNSSNVFTANATALASPVVSAPGPAIDTQRPQISWNTVAGAISYDVWVNNLSTGEAQIFRKTVNGTSVAPSTDLGIGKFRVWVRAIASGHQSAWSTGRDFTIRTPASFAAIDVKQTTSRPTLSWIPLPGAAKYDFWLNNLTTGQPQVIRNSQLTVANLTPGTSLQIGKYRMWVRGIDASGLAAAWSTPVTFDVVTPPTPDSSINSTFDRTPEFRWAAVSGAVYYDVYIRNMTTGSVSTYPRNIAATQWTPSSNLSDGPYRWWVQAVSAQGFRSAWSSAVDIYVGGRAFLQTPSESSSNRKPQFHWLAVDGAATYQLWVSRIDVPAVVLNLSGIVSTSYTPSTSLAVGNYRFWIRAISTTGELSPWSLAKDFSII
jgi:uncharacterized protein (TIGR03790 family)